MISHLSTAMQLALFILRHPPQSLLKWCSTPLEQFAACQGCHRLSQFVQKATEGISVQKSVFTLNEYTI